MQNMDKNIEKLEESAELLKAIAHPVRLCMIKGVYENGKCNVNHMQNCLDLPQSTISTHLAKLRSIGVLTNVREGNEVYYEVKNKKVIEILKVMGLVKKSSK